MFQEKKWKNANSEDKKGTEKAVVMIKHEHYWRGIRRSSLKQERYADNKPSPTEDPHFMKFLSYMKVETLD